MRAITRRGLPFALAGLAASVAVAIPLATAPSASAAEPVVVANHTFENGETHGWAPRTDERGQRLRLPRLARGNPQAARPVA